MSMQPTNQPTDRGVPAFIMSLVGILVLVPLGIWGYLWAKETEKHYKNGTLPPDNQGLVTAAKILGILCIIGTAIIAALIILLVLLVILG